MEQEMVGETGTGGAVEQVDATIQAEYRGCLR